MITSNLKTSVEELVDQHGTSAVVIALFAEILIEMRADRKGMADVFALREMTLNLLARNCPSAPASKDREEVKSGNKTPDISGSD